jgi:hypothetical protein
MISTFYSLSLRSPFKSMMKAVEDGTTSDFDLRGTGATTSNSE